MSSDSPAVPRTEHPIDEHKVCAIWQEVLALPDLPAAADDFFALGGDSTAMLMVELRIHEELAVELPTGSLLTAPTVRELARLIEHTKLCGS
jgi:acyl carrier protein